MLCRHTNDCGIDVLSHKVAIIMFFFWGHFIQITKKVVLTSNGIELLVSFAQVFNIHACLHLGTNIIIHLSRCEQFVLIWYFGWTDPLMYVRLYHH